MCRQKKLYCPVCKERMIHIEKDMFYCPIYDFIVYVKFADIRLRK